MLLQKPYILLRAENSNKGKDLTSKQKGDLGSSAALHWFISKGWEVLMPFGDRRPYDLVIEKNGVFKRVQCKYVSKKCVYKKVYKCTLGTYCPNKKTRTYYTQKDFDYLWVKSPDNSWMIPTSALLNLKGKMKRDANLGREYDAFIVV